VKKTAENCHYYDSAKPEKGQPIPFFTVIGSRFAL